MIRQILAAAWLLGVTAPVCGVPIIIGERLTLASKILGEDRTVLVSLPASYSRSVDRYPVLYLTDAQWNFDHVRSTAALLARNGLMPEIIIVGVTNPDRTHDLYATRADFKDGDRTIPFPTSGNADHFLEFVEKELIPWTDATYRTTPLRMLAGHSAGGNFALHALRTRPALFQVIIAASPWLAWDDAKELKELLPFLASPGLKTRSLFLSSANEGAAMTGNLEAVTGALRSRKDSALHWSYAAYPTDTHDTVVVKAYFDALWTIFADYSFPRDPKTNILKGSLEDVKAHYRLLGERLGFHMLPPEATVNELGYRDLRMGDIDAALQAFRYNAGLYPGSSNVWDSLADGLEGAGRKDEAIASCRKAVSLAEASGAPTLESLKKHLDRLQTTGKGAQ